MSDLSLTLWERALRAARSAVLLIEADPDAAGSRAYYASMYAVTALFQREGRSFTKHSAVEAAVHRELIKPGRWPKELGAAYSELRKLRAAGDYGMDRHVTREALGKGLANLHRILDAVRRELPAEFPDPPEAPGGGAPGIASGP